MQGNSRPVSSNQHGPHEHLHSCVTKHLNSTFKEPIKSYNRDAFISLEQARRSINKPIILDSGCGTGESSFNLARLHPEHLIIGIDKSLKRLQRHEFEHDLFLQDNVILLRADLIDFWRLAVEHEWQVEKHYLLYPNPWPKKKHLTRSWHGHAVFPDLLKLGTQLELRSNWPIYIEEFAEALKIAEASQNISIKNVTDDVDISPFEKKYRKSDHELLRLQAYLE